MFRFSVHYFRLFFPFCQKQIWKVFSIFFRFLGGACFYMYEYIRGSYTFIFEPASSAQITKAFIHSLQVTIKTNLLAELSFIHYVTKAHTSPRASMLSSIYHSAVSHAQSSEPRTCRSERDNASKQTDLARASISSSICSSQCSQNQRRNRNLSDKKKKLQP